MPSIDWQKIFELLPFAVGAMRPGSPNAASFMRGGLETNQYLRRQRLLTDRYAREDEYRRVQMANQQADNARTAQFQQAQIGNMAADNQRAEAQAALERLWKFREAATARGVQLGEGADNPLAAQNQMAGDLFGMTQAFNVPPSAMAGTLPNMTAFVSKGVKADAAGLLEGTVKGLPANQRDQVLDDASVSFTWDAASPRLQTALRERGHADGQPIKPSQLRGLFAAAVDPQTGAAWQPKAKSVTAGTGPERAAELLAKIDAANAAGDAAAAAKFRRQYDNLVRWSGRHRISAGLMIARVNRASHRPGVWSQRANPRIRPSSVAVMYPRLVRPVHCGRPASIRKSNSPGFVVGLMPMFGPLRHACRSMPTWARAAPIPPRSTPV